MIVLRELELDDLKIINLWRNKKELVDRLVTNFRFINYETDRLWFDSYMKNRANSIRLAILKDEVLIGTVNLLKIDPVNQKAELSIQISSEHQGKGIGTKVIKMVLEHAFFNINLNKIYLTVLIDNQNAIKLYDRCGFSIEGTLKSEIYKNGKFKDLYIMAILKSEYIKKTSELQ
ncbi:MAG: GNAT family N-acetyltransferase [Sulfurospirillaceae bacterium]|jgi:RimJ/RimL family protein N-acetyltransferase|nr:GNAT family N-acetyltransferase [Sulfurospirillaceae bacterium]MCK9546150.1 GNAT family N-acetyltransferase [Sulfurospirillaceae bacterium]MDY0238080.1 GNAT family protein [Campylobacterales bacterium]